MSFEAGRPAAAGFFCRQRDAERKDVRLPGLVFHDVEFAEVQAQERDMNLMARERGAIVFNVYFRNVQERRAAKIRRIVEPEILNLHRRFNDAGRKLSNFGVHAGLRADSMFHRDAQNRVERQQQNDDQRDRQQEQPEQPFENPLHVEFIRGTAARDNLNPK